MQPRIRYVIAEEFSRRPGGRKKANGAYSGEEFREAVARALLQGYERVTFDLAGSAGYTTGFLDEAFGGLAKYFSLAELERRLEIIAEDDPGAVDIAWQRIRDAASEGRHH